MGGSFRIARIAGIEIRVHFSWIVIFLLVTATLAGSVLPASWSDTKQLVVAAIAALLFFASVLAHELAHSLVARRFGMSVSSITLFLLGGVANLKQEPPNAMAELVMAAAGPITSFVLGGVAYAVQLLGPSVLGDPAMSTVAPVTSYLATVNVAVGIFNLVPGFPLDGGRVLRAIIWSIRKDRTAATRIAARGGNVVAIGIGLLGGLLLLIGDAFGLWYLVIAYFLYEMASGSLTQELLASAAAGARVADVMTTPFASVAPETSVAVLVRDVMLPGNVGTLPVIAEGRVLGIVTIAEVRRVEEARWPNTRVDSLMRPTPALPAVESETPLLTVIEKLDGLPFIPVTREGAIVAMLYPEAVAAYLRTREALGMRHPAAGRA